jgi:hypothetical protein
MGRRASSIWSCSQANRRPPGRACSGAEYAGGTPATVVRGRWELRPAGRGGGDLAGRGGAAPYGPQAAESGTTRPQACHRGAPHGLSRDRLCSATLSAAQQAYRAFVRTWRARAPKVVESLEGSGRGTADLLPVPRESVEVPEDHQRHRAAPWRIPAPRQDAGLVAECPGGRVAAVWAPGHRADPDAPDRWVARTGNACGGCGPASRLTA